LTSFGSSPSPSDAVLCDEPTTNADVERQRLARLQASASIAERETRDVDTDRNLEAVARTPADRTSSCISGWVTCALDPVCVTAKRRVGLIELGWPGVRAAVGTGQAGATTRASEAGRSKVLGWKTAATGERAQRRAAS
jgi:hypothetical protein